MQSAASERRSAHQARTASELKTAPNARTATRLKRRAQRPVRSATLEPCPTPTTPNVPAVPREDSRLREQWSAQRVLLGGTSRPTARIPASRVAPATTSPQQARPRASRPPTAPTRRRQARRAPPRVPPARTAVHPPARPARTARRASGVRTRPPSAIAASPAPTQSLAHPHVLRVRRVPTRRTTAPRRTCPTGRARAVAEQDAHPSSLVDLEEDGDHRVAPRSRHHVAVVHPRAGVVVVVVAEPEARDPEEALVAADQGVEVDVGGAQQTKKQSCKTTCKTAASMKQRFRRKNT